MKRETIIASTIGIILGVGVAVAVLLRTMPIQQAQENVIAEEDVSPTPVPQREVEEYVLDVTEPQNDIISDSDTIRVEGKASEDSLMVIQSPVGQEVFQNDAEAFSIDFPLALGENVILVALYPNDDPAGYQEKEINVYYFPE